jgi:hypothetical protein
MPQAKRVARDIRGAGAEVTERFRDRPPAPARSETAQTARFALTPERLRINHNASFLCMTQPEVLLHECVMCKITRT